MLQVRPADERRLGPGCSVTLNNEAGGTTLVRTNYGFIQHGFHEFLVWSGVKGVTQ